MKILAFSDITEWEGYEELVDKIKPDIITLAGDLTWDGFASFRLRSRGIKKKTHVDKFYQFLKYTGKKSIVLVVKGNHDEDFEGDYDIERINRIPGCKEISGKTIEIKGLRFLGLGFNETYRLKILRPLIEKFKEKIDVVIMHGIRLHLISQLGPKIIVRGGIGPGKYLINNVPCIFTAGSKITIIELKDKKPLKILQYIIALDNRLKLLKKSSLIPAFERYKWLKPYLGHKKFFINSKCRKIQNTLSN